MRMDGSQQLADWIRSGETRVLCGRRIFVHTAVTPGRPPLLLIHGYPTASYDWVRIWPRLATRHSLYALDLLGFGLSDKPRGSRYPIEQQADFRRRHRSRWVGALVESSVPRRLICGAVDPVSGRHLAERYRELVPDPDVVLLDDVGHYPQLEAPDRVVDEYEAFRARVDARLSRTRTP
jgi:pimeloyl-ACP methyl ester carboxylesterase